MPWLTIIQVAMLVAWYTALPTLPAWVVFLPLILGVAGLTIFGGLALLGLIVGIMADR